MHWSRISMLLPLAGVATASFSCVNFDVPMSFEAPLLVPTFPRFKSHYDTVQFLNDLSVRPAGQSGSPWKATPVNISVDVTVAAQYCYPSEYTSGVVQVLTHGVGFDHSYWHFGGPSSEYNYVKAATEAGYATLTYDRIGTGNSTKTDPYTTQQLGTGVEVLGILTTYLWKGGLSKLAKRHIAIPSKVAHVGHSFGSVISETFVGSSPSSSDALVLTGFSVLGQFGTDFLISTDLHIANEADPERFGDLGNGYLTWGDELSNQYSFLTWPYFDPAVLRQAEATKWPFAIGDVLTAFATKQPNYNGPLLVCIISIHFRAIHRADLLPNLVHRRCLRSNLLWRRLHIRPPGQGSGVFPQCKCQSCVLPSRLDSTC